MTSSVQKNRRRLQRLLKCYPPFLGAGIKVKRISEDLRSIEVHMPLRFWNRNYVGTHFGGSLYSMCDPFFMLILASHLGRDYIVWDKAATIRFKKPGRGLVKATFSISETRVNEIRAQADAQDKTEPQFQVAVTDSDGNVVAEVDKLLYVRRKDRQRTRGQAVSQPQDKFSLSPNGH
jgi:acyl-coenzyme A thioesterase PaaI-like protein